MRCSNHRVSGVSYNVDLSKVTATELDSHADSPVVGWYSRILEETGRKATVSGFTSDLGKPITVLVVNAAVTYDCNVYILVICNALYFKNMEENLVPPFMMRLAGIDVNECPKFLAKIPSESNHSMYFPDADVRVPFQLEGIISHIPMRIPSTSELDEQTGSYLLLTPNMPTWDPHTPIYRDQEDGMTNYNGNIKQKCPDTLPDDTNVFDRRVACVGDNTHLSALIAAVKTLKDICIGGGVQSVHRKGKVMAADLVLRLKVPIEMAKKILKATTQLGVRTVNELSLTRKFQTNDRMLRYP